MKGPGHHERMHTLMQHLAMGVDAALHQTAGQPMGFVILAVQNDGGGDVECIGNLETPRMKELFLNLIQRWDQNSGVVQVPFKQVN